MIDDDLKHMHRVMFIDDEGADNWHQIDDAGWIERALNVVVAILLGAAFAVAVVLWAEEDQPMDSVPESARFESTVKGNWL